jgi:LmbE family N-acetylglucosaminyl deacetylase
MVRIIVGFRLPHRMALGYRGSVAASFDQDLLDRLTSSNTRLLLVGAHNDDVELFCGRLILSSRGEIHALYTAVGPPERHLVPLLLRAGQPRGDTRIGESIAAMDELGVDRRRLSFLRYPDQSLHRYPQCIDEIAAAIREIAPDYVLVHAYEGGHPDHDTTSCYTVLASRIVGFPLERMVEYAGYNRRRGEDILQSFLPHGETTEYVLTPSEAIQTKWKKAMAAFASQPLVLGQLVTRSECEKFRILPRHDYSRPPTSLGFLRLRGLLSWLPFNIGILLPRTARLRYEESWCKIAKPLKLAARYRAISESRLSSVTGE